MSERLPKHLHDALAAARLAIEFVGAADLIAYGTNALLRSAVERQLEILGEACRRALEDTPALRSRLPAAALATALRNRIIHGYDRVEHAIVFDVVRKDLPGLVEGLERELEAAAGM